MNLSASWGCNCGLLPPSSRVLRQVIATHWSEKKTFVSHKIWWLLVSSSPEKYFIFGNNFIQSVTRFSSLLDLLDYFELSVTGTTAWILLDSHMHRWTQNLVRKLDAKSSVLDHIKDHPQHHINRRRRKL